MLAQVEAEKEAAPPKPEKKLPAAKLGTAEQAAEAEAEEEQEEEEEDPVEAALSRYGIITENPWEKGVKCARSLTCSPLRGPSDTGLRLRVLPLCLLASG